MLNKTNKQPLTSVVKRQTCTRYRALPVLPLLAGLLTLLADARKRGVQFVDHFFKFLPAFVEQFQVCGIGDVGWGAGGVQHKFALVVGSAAGGVLVRIRVGLLKLSS